MKSKIIAVAILLPAVSFSAATTDGSGASGRDLHDSSDKKPIRMFSEFMPGVHVFIDNDDAAETFIREYSLFMSNKEKYVEASKIRREIQHLIPLTIPHEEMMEFPLAEKAALRAHRLVAELAYADCGGIKARIVELYKKLRKFQEVE